MLDADYSVRAARRASRMFLPGEKFAISSLKDPTRLYNTWVFRCKVRGTRSTFVCKLSTPDDLGRGKILNQYERLKSVKSGLEDPLFTTPQALAFFEKECALIMEDVVGETLLQLIPNFIDISDSNAYLRQAGRWISHFQHPTMRQTIFEPKSHTNWLRRKIQNHDTKIISIPDYADFMREFRILEELSEKAKSLPSMRCISHRDFHLGNVVFGRNGAVYGIDFENKKEDESLRDVMSFMFDLIIRWDKPVTDITQFQRAASVFWDGYSDGKTSHFVFDYFQRFSALNAWSGLGARNALSVNKLRKLEFFKMLSRTPMLGNSPHMSG